ncbi:armadillo-type protein [Mycena capillaripes]|nr:armadillo-type protein [Mycena capillaripes]
MGEMVQRRWLRRKCGTTSSERSNPQIQLSLLQIHPYVQFVSGLSDKSLAVVANAINVLANAACWQEGAEAVVQAKVQDHVLSLLQYPNRLLRESSSRLIRNLACHEVTAVMLLQLNPFIPLVSCLSDEYPVVVEHATSALAAAAWWPDGAKALVRAKVQDHVPKLLESPTEAVRQLACGLVQNLALHEAASETILKTRLCGLLISLLNDRDSGVSGTATAALVNISDWRDGAAILAGMGTEFSPQLEKMVNTDHMHIIQENLARYEKESQIPETTDLLLALWEEGQL